MSLWGKMTQKEAQNFATFMSRERPFKGAGVRIFKGRKHKGKEGIVFWHGLDKFANTFRYGSPNSQALAEVQGRHGYRVGIETEDGEKFFVPAEYTTILHSPEKREEYAYCEDNFRAKKRG